MDVAVDNPPAIDAEIDTAIHIRIGRHRCDQDNSEHAERITDRILFLEGLPNYQKLLPLRIGQTVKEQFEADLAVEMEAVDALRPAIALCREKGDITTANIFEDILEDEEEHVDYLETNLELIGKLGEQLYLSQLVERPPTNG